jgi:hypothetical protein
MTIKETVVVSEHLVPGMTAGGNRQADNGIQQSGRRERVWRMIGGVVLIAEAKGPEKVAHCGCKELPEGKGKVVRPKFYRKKRI